MRFFKLLLKDILSLFTEEEETLHLERFSFPEEIPTIMKVAREYFERENIEYPVNPYALLFAIREAEKGRKGFEFGITSAKDTDLETQCKYACETIINNVKRYHHQTDENDFITFLGSRYAPVGADNDPHNLNAHWVRNVKFFYNIFTGGN